MTSQTLPAHPYPGAPVRALLRTLLLAATAFLAIGATAGAQQTDAVPAAAQRGDTTQRSALRVELEARAASLEAAGKREEAATVRRRLAEGDFPVGDRVFVEVTGSLTFSDTLAIRSGQLISVANLPDISLRGVLRPELTDYLTRQIGRYVRDPVVHTQSLVRISITGPVARPGFYSVPADILLGDAIMRAGGPAQDSDVQRTVVKRGKAETLNRDAVQRAIRSGSTLEQIGVRAGDEIAVGQQRKINWIQGLLVAASVVTSVAALVSLLD